MPESRQNFRLTVAYDGRAYFGWQRHGDKPTVQHALEQALGAVFETEIEVRGAGRTDRGAHANGQVASASLPAGIDIPRSLSALRKALPADIRALSLEPMPEDFHARSSAVAKHYRYVILNAAQCPQAERGRVWHVPGPLDVDAMREALPIFVGAHDFGSFATKPKHDQRSTVREVKRFELHVDGPTIEFSIYADGFLYKMVRNIVRAVVKVGEGRYDLERLRQILGARDRKAAPGTAPASGLYLERVFYSLDEMGA
ncbi:MAG: tRNA pseudouridine(38-40) synthase TruA [Deltaproteobacteria bacterium]|nr:tRNA pseudouridine(38-40) synthase TruA [Deltaproteobacteria bacterium]